MGLVIDCIWKETEVARMISRFLQLDTYVWHSLDRKWRTQARLGLGVCSNFMVS